MKNNYKPKSWVLRYSSLLFFAISFFVTTGTLYAQPFGNFCNRHVLNFDGTNDYLSVSPANLSNTAGSIELWLSMTNWADRSNNGMIISNGIDQWGDNSFHLSMHPDLSVGLHFRYGGGHQSGNTYLNTTITDAFAPHSWHHIALTWEIDGGITDLRLYVDGILRSSQSTSLTVAIGSNFFFGRNPGMSTGTNMRSGRMAEIRTFSTARTAAQIAEDMNVIRALTGVASETNYWALDQESGTTVLNGVTGASAATLLDFNMNINSGWNVYSADPNRRVLTFDGSNDYLTASPSNLDNNAGTIEFWLQRPNWALRAADYTLFSNGIHHTVNNSFYLSIHFSVGLHWRYGGTGQSGPFLNTLQTDNLLANSWNHIALTWERVGVTTFLKMFLNGQMVASTSTSVFVTIGSNLHFGRNPWPDGSFISNSNMAEFRTFNTARTAEQIQSDMNTTLALIGSESNYWPFNEAHHSGNNASNLVSGGSTANLINFNNNAASGWNNVYTYEPFFEKPTETFDLTVTQPTCNVTTGRIGIVGLNNTDFTYSFDNGATFQASPSKSSLTDGAYDVIIREQSGCYLARRKVTINPPLPVPTIPVITETQPDCDVATGTIEVMVQNASDVYSYDNGNTYSSSPIQRNLDPGTHKVLIRNSSGCISDTVTATITAHPNSPAKPQFAVTQPSCDLATGTITVTVQNATNTYSFDHGETFQASNTKSNLAPGIYFVMVKNADGCLSAMRQATVNNQPVTPEAPAMNRIGITQPSCNVATGSLSITNLISSDTYSFDDGATFQSSNAKTDLAPGTYSLKIKNGAGCISPATEVTLNPQPVKPANPVVALVHPGCDGNTIGTATVTVQNATDLYSFNNGVTFQTSNVNSNLAPGNYNIIIRNNVSCNSEVTAITINNPAVKPTQPAVAVDQPNCDLATGTLTVTVQNTTDTYSFDNGATFQASNIRTGLNSGNYHVIVRNSAGCNSTAREAIINAQPALPSTPVFEITQPTCDVATGTVTVTVQNSTDVYSFDNGANYRISNVRSGLAPGNYQVRIRNSQGCISQAAAVVVVEAIRLSRPEVQTTQPTCQVSTGTITVTAQNSNETYSFNNGVTFQSSNTLSGLTRGAYRVIIRSAQGCNSPASEVFVNDAPAIPATPVLTISQPTCDVATGSITVKRHLATDTYSFNNGASFQTSNVRSGMTSGTHQVLVRNAEGCVSSATAAMINNQPITPPQPTITITDSDSGIVLMSSEAAGYQWYKHGNIFFGATERGFYPESNGSYFVVVFSADGCPSMTSDTLVIDLTSVNYTLNQSEINIYPNPVINMLNIEINSSLKGDADVMIYDFTGKLVSTTKGLGTININTSHFAPGNYMVTVYQEGKLISRNKIIKN
jgi:hypothetical protein